MRQTARQRLDRVYNKVAIARHSDLIAKKVLMLDSDMIALSEESEGIWRYLDDPGKIFAGVMRGIRDWPEDRCRDSNSYVERGQRRVGGVNGGCLLFRNSQTLADEMIQALQRQSEGASGGGAEQDFFGVLSRQDLAHF